MGDRRFDHPWAEWDRRRTSGEPKATFITGSPDAVLVEMLAADAATDRPLDRNIIATELLNRVRRKGVRAPAVFAATSQNMASAARTMEAARQALHESRSMRDESRRSRSSSR